MYSQRLYHDEALLKALCRRVRLPPITHGIPPAFHDVATMLCGILPGSSKPLDDHGLAGGEQLRLARRVGAACGTARS